MITLFSDDELGLIKKKVCHQKGIEKAKGSKDLTKTLNMISKKGKYSITKDEMKADFILCADLKKPKKGDSDDEKEN